LMCPEAMPKMKAKHLESELARLVARLMVMLWAGSLGDSGAGTGLDA